MMDGWLQERSDASTDSLRCNLAKVLESASIGDGNDKGRKKGLKKKTSKSDECENRRPTVGSFMAQAREACKLKYLIGAAPVCYGVPTSIWRKETPK
ncbi:ESP1 [Linum grandiflorum]